ncbi:MAG: hypothetical protein COY81_00475 [Candidatus Pacebacteria bacterium CG_4_10_14_0_8_um_filter_43_12]|uniref:Uncharacterized protein n=1 Tax=Candidatus Roizmanbacteria bacterium CG_4_9_14_0_2_um_filter_39_13 TaxID=1974839 RepID=A0A2M8F4X6_9BACT|nr:MAG: hypothetical protein COY81_00475 [Candidatus Pacebacteria bacterium CG_4_10_14_0_8_um_filter_43_12]PIZ79478.1 MAG: hypothetical protein COY01_00965 [Candidatus Pacebacteria bacterium CG_4_10_14_0_2_um_filter_40_20]PJC34356.1 MAG: hypothetical protein CO051_00060 [Candidatus Roizmanbacteria bacterium CG_4_9_14_0_2_um_filter_39_13]
MKTIINALQTVFREPFYRKIALGVILGVGYLSYWLLYQTTTIPTFLENMRNGDFGQYSYLYGVTFIITTLLIIGLSGISVAITVWLFRYSQKGTGKTLGANIGGLTVAAFGMGCPVCGAFLFSAIGIVAGFTILPLQGLELKLLSLAFLIGSTVYGAKKVVQAQDCNECKIVPLRKVKDMSSQAVAQKPVHSFSHKGTISVFPLEKIFVFALASVFFINQLLMSQVMASMGMTRGNFASRIFGIRTAAAYTIIAPQLNSDGRTTSLVEQPTIIEVPANPNSGDALADARVVMIPTGKPFYAPDDVSFDDPINAQNKWGAYEDSITISGDLQNRYNQLINTFTCNYCCGGPSNVTAIARCGCRHAKAWRGMFKYMLQNYGDRYTNEELMGEAYRWTGIWYPKGVLEDYLLATGNEDVLGHQTHGGAGSDGRHGL